MSRKISLRIILYFLGFYAALVILTISLLVFYLAEPFFGFSIYSTIKEVERDHMELHVKEDLPGDYFFSDELIEFTLKNQGILQLINPKGEVVESTSDDSDLPNKYYFSDLQILNKLDKYYSWSIKDEMILLFTEKTESDILMEKLIKLESFPILTAENIVLLEDSDAVFDLYDGNGKLINTTGEQKTLDFTTVLTTHFNLVNSKELKTFHTMEDGTVAIIRMPNKQFQSFEAVGYNIIIKFLIAIAVFHVALLIIIIIFSLLIGRRFGRPLLYFLRRIERLAKNDYKDIDDKKLRVAKSGKLKKRYKMYEDVDNSLTVLTNNLIENEQKIKATEKLREDWITGLSHDLKTPLSAVLGYSAMLGSNHEWSKGELTKFANIIEDKANYMDELINDLTYTYQLKNKGIVLELVDTELNQFINSFLQNRSLSNVYFTEHDKCVNVLIDPKRFVRVLDNLIGNAMIHNPVNTVITLQVYSESDQTVIEIKDDGIGMSEETLTNLFNRYYRGTNTTSGDDGTGLGLTIAKQLIEAHAGKINVTSDSNGTVIKIKLPQNH